MPTPTTRRLNVDTDEHGRLFRPFGASELFFPLSEDRPRRPDLPSQPLLCPKPGQIHPCYDVIPREVLPFPQFDNESGSSEFAAIINQLTSNKSLPEWDSLNESKVGILGSST